MTLISTQIKNILYNAISHAYEIDEINLPRNLLNTLEIDVERPKNPDHGHFASNIALKLSAMLNKKPFTIAETIVKHIKPNDTILIASVMAPGFINIKLTPEWLTAQIDTIRSNPSVYGNPKIDRIQNIQVEYVSVNPTGNLHIGHARGAIIGSVLSKILSTSGYNVTQEYYLNDAGSQIEKFNNSLYIRYQQQYGINASLPEEAYVGDDIISLAKKIKAEYGDKFLNHNNSQEFADIGQHLVVLNISNSLKRLGIKFDVWFSEKSLFESGQHEKTFQALKSKKLVAEHDGATWFLTTKMGQEKDDVLIRRDGTPTYFASDIAYHDDKFNNRNFDTVINIWGSDHQGQVPRLKAALSALEIEENRLNVILVQMVRVKKGTVSEKLSKRNGTTIPLSDLVDEVGADACRFMFLTRSHDSQLDFDLDIAIQNTSENPVYYVQYAHARTCSIINLADKSKIDYSSASKDLLVEKVEFDLINKMVDLQSILHTIVVKLEPHHLPHYASELAATFHNFYQQCRVISTDPSNLELSKSRLQLVDATRIILYKCLNLMGVNAPNKM